MPTVDGYSPDKPRAIALWLTLALLLALAIGTHWADQPPAAQPLDAPAGVFSAQRAARVLQALVGDGTAHPLASAADERIRGQIVRYLGDLGIATELQEGWACDVTLACGRVVNIIGRIEGTDLASGSVLLAAHYDSVPAGPGAGDDGVGVASVLEIARILKQQPARRHPIILLIDEGEEAGLLGARLFVSGRPEARTVKAAVNLDARGDSGPSLMFETGPATNWALRMFAEVAARPMSNSLYYFVYKLLPNDTDFTVFKAAGYEGFNFALIGSVERYHTPQDRIENLDLRSLQHQGQNALSTIQALAASDLSVHPAAGAVFFDVFSRSLWHWPASWSPWLGLVLVVSLLFALWALKRRIRVSALAIAYGLAALLVSWAAAVIACAVLLTAVRAIGAVPPSDAYGWAAYPGGMHAAAVALALLAAAGGARLFVRRTNAWGLWLAFVLVQAALALLCALKFPELSYVFFAPVLAALLGALWALRPRPTAGLPALSVTLPVLGAALTFIPILLPLYPALGADAWPAITGLAGLAAIGLTPLLTAAAPQVQRAYLWSGLAVVALSFGITLFLPAYSARMPQRTLLWYTYSADQDKAVWLLQPDSKRAPPELHLRASMPSPQPMLPSGPVSAPVFATAPHGDLAPPELQVLGVEKQGSAFLYHVHVRSVRAAPEIELAVTDDREVGATLDLGPEQRVPAHFWRAPDGVRWLQLIGVGPEGLDLTLEAAGPSAPALAVLDRSYGVPANAVRQHPVGAARTTASQDGDLTVVYRSVRLEPGQAASGP